MRVETLTPVVAAAPGARVRWRIRVENDSTTPVGYRLRVIGFDEALVLQPPPRPPLEAGSADELELELAIPEAFAAGHHSIAVEVTPDRAGVAPVIAAVTVTVGTLDDVALAVVPSTIRARRRATFKVDIDNRSKEPRELELEGDSAELQIRMQPERIMLLPGERVRTTGRIKAPPHVSGEPRQHSLTVAARSRSAPSYAQATFQQRALFPRGLRTMLAMLLIAGIWGGALGAGYLWWQSRSDEEEQVAAELVDVDGDGVRETPADQLIDTDGDGVGDTTAAVVAERVAAGDVPGEPQPGGSDVPTRTSMGGTVAAADGGEAPGVDVTLTPIDLGAPRPAGATQLGFVNGALREVEPVTAAKYWPARFGRYRPDVRSGFRQTQSVPDATATDGRGVWFFGSVSVGQSYEVAFSRPGYTTQSFVVTPSADGRPIDLPVEMETADGVVRGSVSGPGGGLGNVKLELSDGPLVFDSATASQGDVGTFTFTGVSTPGTYTLRATAPGLGTEVVQVTLEEGEDRGGVDIRMSTGVGSIRGRITEGGLPLGGVTLTASNGDTTVTTTSLTEGATGTYLFPRLTIPGRWTVQAQLDGYVTQTRLVTLNGNATGIDFAFVKQTGSIIGVVESSSGGPLPGTNIRVSRDDLFFESQSAVSPDPGSFDIRDVPPGTYLVELSRYDHEPTSQQVTIGPGQVADLGTVTLVFRPRPDIPQDGGLEVQVVDSEGNPIIPSTTAPGATVRVFRASDNTLVAEQVGAPDQSSFFFQPLPVGTYRVDVSRGVTYRLATRRVSVGLTNVVLVVPIYLLGQVHGRVIDSFDKEVLVDYDVQIRRVNPNGSLSEPVQNLPVRGNNPDGTRKERFETANPPGLTSGIYQLTVDNPPPGYRVVYDQVLQEGMPPMQFLIRPDNDTPIDLGDIEADRFPEVSGVVLAARLGAGNVVSFVPINRADLVVALTCAGVDTVDNTLTLTEQAPPHDQGERPNTGLGEIPGSEAGFDTFFFSPQSLEGADLFGACTLTVSIEEGGVYTAANIDVTVSPGDGSVQPQLIQNVVLFRPEDVGGRLYWTDDGPTAEPRVWAAGVRVEPQGEVTVGMTPGTVPFDSPESAPLLEGAILPPVITDANGAWAYIDPKQVFGEAFYTMSAPGVYALRRIRLTIDETRKTAVGVEPQDSTLFVSDDGTLVELDAAGGVITTQLNVRTIKGSPRSPAPLVLTGFGARLTGANDIPASFTLAGGNPSAQVQAARAQFTTPDPGTHQWTVSVPAPVAGRPLFVPVDGADAPSATFFQDRATNLAPSAALPQLTKTYAEMGAMSLHVANTRNVAFAGATGTLTSLADGAEIPFTTDALGNATVVGLPVSTALNGTGSFRIKLDGPVDLVLGKARFDVVNDGGPSGSCTGNECSVVVVAQGGRPQVNVTVPRYGTLTGAVLGNNGLGGDGEPLVPPALRVFAERVADANCNELGPEPARPVLAVDTDGVGGPDSFRIAGDEGLYRLRFEHDAYQSNPTAGPPQQRGPPFDQYDDYCEIPNPAYPTLPPLPPVPEFIQNPDLTGFIYRVSDDVDRALDEPFFTLLIRPSEMTVTVTNDSTTAGAGDVGDGVDEATVTASGTAGTFTVDTDDDGVALFAGGNSLPPGGYTIRVTKVDATGASVYFTLQFTLQIPPGGRPVTLAVPLPRIGAVITGTVGAANSEGDAVQPPPGIVVTDANNLRDPEASGATVGTPANPPPATVPATPDPDGPPGAPSTYEFQGVTSGVHTLSFNDVDAVGYDPPTPNPIPAVSVLGPVTVPDPVPLVNYRALNRSVEVTVRDVAGNPVNDARVELRDPDGTTATLTTGSAGVYRFTAVPPEINPYNVVVSKDLFTTVGPTPLTVPPGDPNLAVTPAAPVTLRGNSARIQGRVELLSSPGNQGPLTTANSVQLVRVANGAPVGTAVTPDASGNYTITTGIPDLYRVRVSGDGFATRFSADRNVVLGQSYPNTDVVVPALATVTITVVGPAANTVTGRAVPTSASTPAAAAPGVNVSDFTFLVDPGDTWRFEFTTTAGYVPLTVPPTALQLDPGATNDVIDAVMQPRTITGTITAGATAVRAVSSTGAPSVGGTVTGTTYTVTGVGNGTWTIEGAGLGVGRGVSSPATVVNATTGNVTDIAVVLSPRPVSVVFTGIGPATANVALEGGAAQDAVGGNATFTRTENLFPLDWTVTADGFVPRSNAPDAPVTIAAPGTPPDVYATPVATPVGPIQLARPEITATVAPVGGGANVATAFVLLCAGTVTTCAPTTIGAVPMMFADGVYRIQAPGSGSFTVGASLGLDVAVPVGVTVSAAGIVTPSPVALTLVAPPTTPTSPGSPTTPGG